MENYLVDELNCFNIFGLREFRGKPYLKENGYLQDVSLEGLGNVFYFYLLFCYGEGECLLVCILLICCYVTNNPKF